MLNKNYNDVRLSNLQDASYQIDEQYNHKMFSFMTHRSDINEQWQHSMTNFRQTTNNKYSQMRIYTLYIIICIHIYVFIIVDLSSTEQDWM